MAGLSGKILGGFRILKQIQAEESAQGIVCMAVCETADGRLPVSKGQVVALKVMPVRDDDQRQQWRKLESRTRELSQIDHPNVVRYYGCFCEQGEWNQLHVIVQEFLEGETLKERLERFPSGLDVDEGLQIAEAAISGLAHTADKGIVHRDIKPGNIFICERPVGDRRQLTVKLIDFEIAKQGHGSTTASTGNLRGSFNYMAPEFLDAKFRGDLLSDVFSMGVTLHEMLTGKLPYELIDGNSADAILDFVARWKRLSEGMNAVVVNANINRLLAHTDTLFAGCLSPDRLARFKSYDEFKAAINRVRFRTLTNPATGSAYQMLQFIGKGGFGEVFKARQTKTGEIVAIKHLRRAKCADRFKREAKILGKVNDSCFVRFVEAFSRELDGKSQEFLVMGFLEGMPGNSLWDAINRSRKAGLPPQDVFTAFIRYAHGLKMLHVAGVYHRDIKPANLYYPAGHPEKAAIMDLGIARDTKGTLTVGSVPGTPAYMPPEVVSAGSRGEGGMDVYALGLCLYEALTTKTAFAKLSSDIEGFRQLVDRVNKRVRPNFADSRIDADVLELLTDMTAFNPAARIRDMAEVEHRLRRLLAKMGRTTPSSTALTPPDEERPLSPAVKKGIWCAVLVACGLSAAVGAGWLALPWVKEMYAQRRLREVLSAYERSAGNAEILESAWIVEFNPHSYSWLRLPETEYAQCTNAIHSAKTSVIVGQKKLKCLDRMNSCILPDGTLSVDNYAEMDDWNEPLAILDKDSLKQILKQIAVPLKKELEKNFLEPDVRNRRANLAKNDKLLANSWSRLVLGEEGLKREQKALEKAKSLIVGEIHNHCPDELIVCGTTIPSGRRLSVRIASDNLKKREICRKGYKPIPLPPDFDGRVVEISPEKFEALPVKFRAPFMRNGVSLFIQNKELVSGAEIELSPGKYEGIYRRKERIASIGPIYKDNRIEFTILVNTPARIPPPPEKWEQTEAYTDYLKSPVDVTIPALANGIVCRIDGEVKKSGRHKITPGAHTSVYDRVDYQPQRKPFETVVGQSLELEGPGTWIPTEGLTNLNAAKGSAAREEWAEVEKILPRIQVVAEENKKALSELHQKVVVWQAETLKKKKEKEESERNEREYRHRELYARLDQLLRRTPYDDRRKRLEQAAKLLLEETTKQILADAEREKFVQKLKTEKDTVVGQVRNACGFPIRIDGDIGIGTNELKEISYLSSEKRDIEVTARGYNLKKLATRELDGREYVVRESDLDAADVEVRIRGDLGDIVARHNGNAVSASFKIKPGQGRIVFSREGYEQQEVSFDARITDGCEIQVPKSWKLLPVEVSIPRLEEGIVCWHGTSMVTNSISLKPGIYTFRYSRMDCQDQNVSVEVERGTPITVPKPGLWKETAAVEMLAQAEAAADVGEWDRVEKDIAQISVQTEENTSRLTRLKTKLDDHKKSVREENEHKERERKKAEELRKFIDFADLAYSSEDWYDCVRHYHEAYQKGYQFDEDSKKKLVNAYNKASLNLRKMNKKAVQDMGAGRTPIRRPDELDKELRQLNTWYVEMSR